MIYFFAGFFIGGIASMLLYSLVVSERINELELENGRLIDDLTKPNMKLENTSINIGDMDMMGLKKRNKPKESTNVQIKLNVTVSDTENSNSCNIVDSLLNDIWNIALAKEGVEAQNMTSKYMKEKVAK